MPKENYDPDVIDDFGNEWEAYDQSSVSVAELEQQFQDYFILFSWSEEIINGTGADFGCGSGRWARFVAPRVNSLICIDASNKAIRVASNNTSALNNCYTVQARIDRLPIPDNTLDFGYSLGVLHHLPKTGEAIKNCSAKLKPGAPFLVYLYYAFDNRPKWYASIWKCSDVLRGVISKLPFRVKYLLSNLIALSVYYPFARLAYVFEKFGADVTDIPLAEYRQKSFYTMRAGALDRFGTRLENRFTRLEIKTMMEDAGLINVRFSNIAPYWCALGTKQ